MDPRTNRVKSKVIYVKTLDRQGGAQKRVATEALCLRVFYRKVVKSHHRLP